MVRIGKCATGKHTTKEGQSSTVLPLLDSQRGSRYTKPVFIALGRNDRRDVHLHHHHDKRHRVHVAGFLYMWVCAEMMPPRRAGGQPTEYSSGASHGSSTSLFSVGFEYLLYYRRIRNNHGTKRHPPSLTVVSRLTKPLRTWAPRVHLLLVATIYIISDER